MEKNLLLAIFSLWRNILADLLGFIIKNSREFIVNCGNHRVTWQILYISYESFSKELFRVYVIDSLREKKPLKSNNFIQWRNDRVSNPSYHLLYDLTFNIFLGLTCFRSSLRRSNSLHALAGRQKVSPIMFIGNHHIYKSVIVNDMKIRVQAPREVRRASSRGVQGVQTPALFQYSPNCALKFLNQFRRNPLKNRFKKRKNPSKRCTSSILLKFFNAT